jgi:hypothetical protein
MLPQGPQIIGYLGGSLHILFAYEKDEDGEPFDVDGYDAVLNIYQMKPRKLVESVEMTNPEPNRIEAIFSVDDVEELPQNGRYEILFTDKIDSTVTFAMHRDRFAISDVYKSGTTIATVNVSVGDSIETIVNVKFGTIPIKGEQGDSGEPLNVVGDLNDPSELPATGEPGEAYIINTEIWVWSPTSGEFVNMGSFTGPPGATPEIGGNGNWFIDGTDTGVQAKGEDGRGIESITLHDTQGLIKTYRITFTDETTFDFNVTDGEPGADGIQTVAEATDTNFTDPQEGDLQQLESGLWVNKAPAVILDSNYAAPAPLRLNPVFWFESRRFKSFSVREDEGTMFIPSLESLTGDVSADQATESIQPFFDVQNLVFSGSQRLILPSSINLHTQQAIFTISVKFTISGANQFVIGAASVSSEQGFSIGTFSNFTVTVGGINTSIGFRQDNVPQTVTVRVDRTQSVFDIIWGDLTLFNQISGDDDRFNSNSIGTRGSSELGMEGIMPGMCIVEDYLSDTDFFDLHNYMRQI